MSLRVLLNGFRDRRADWGLRRAAYWQIMHTLGRLLDFHIHLVEVGATRDDLRDPEPPEVPPGYETKLCCKEDLQPFVDKVPDFSQEFLDRSMANGDDCAATFYHGELVAFNFETRTRTRVSEQIDVIVPAGFRYSYKAWTHPDHRRRNLSAKCGYLLATQGRRTYDERGIWYIETHNYASRLHSYAHPRLWSIRVGYVGWCNIFGRRIPFNSRWARRIGFEFVTKSDPGNRQYTS